jgi:tetraacyldisaccharide 4'-kinase
MADASRYWRELVWRRRGLRGWALWLALQPASALFAAGVALRNLAYRSGLLRVHHARIPVVSVGNLSVGGSGKTPMTLWLARQLAAGGVAPGGTKVAILLRGYGGKAARGRRAGVTVVSTGSGPQVDVDTAGDEAVMLAKCFSGVVLTARRRIDGVRAAEQLGCNVVVLDDGFQHRALARAFDLVLVTGHRAALLPAGPLREGRGALARADAIALVRRAGEERAVLRARVLRRTPKPVFAVRFTPTALVESDGGRWRELPIALLSGRRVAVVCGIAEPSPFYTAVRQWEALVEEIIEFPDHYRYTQADWQRLARATRDVELIVTTEKDLVKLENFPFAKGKLVALRIAPEIDGGEALLRLVRARLAPRRVTA